jgi:hypothetical protein
MNRFASLVFVIAAACGGGDKSPADAPSQPADATADGTPDAVPDALPLVCDPLAAPGMQGCATGNKCTWIQIEDTPDLIGKLGCVPDGTVALGGACTQGAVGETTGYDNCAAGGICNSSVCKDVCGFDPMVTGSSCSQGEACTRYAGLGYNGEEDAVIGVCNLTCDPVTQTRIVNNVTTSCGTGNGCYLLANAVDTIAVCAGAGAVGHNQTITGTTFANSCLPGHMPRRIAPGLTTMECGSLCKPADVYSGMNESYEGGNSTVTNYANLPATCESAGGATVAPGVPVTGETCQYYWMREPSQKLTPFSNTVGWCFNYPSFPYAPDPQNPATTAPYPRCPTLTTGDVVLPIGDGNDALYFGCIAKPMSLQGKPQSRITQPQLDRLGSYRD